MDDNTGKGGVAAAKQERGLFPGKKAEKGRGWSRAALLVWAGTGLTGHKVFYKEKTGPRGLGGKEWRGQNLCLCKDGRKDKMHRNPQGHESGRTRKVILKRGSKRERGHHQRDPREVTVGGGGGGGGKTQCISLQLNSSGIERNRLTKKKRANKTGKKTVEAPGSTRGARKPKKIETQVPRSRGRELLSGGERVMELPGKAGGTRAQKEGGR